MSKNGLEWKDLDDSKFFTIAMEKCLNNSSNAKFVHRLHKILTENNNIQFLNNESLHNNYLYVFIYFLLLFLDLKNQIFL